MNQRDFKNAKKKKNNVINIDLSPNIKRKILKCFGKSQKMVKDQI